jgi:hypothetical protein
VMLCIARVARTQGRQLLEIALFTAVMQQANPSRSTRRDPDPPTVAARRRSQSVKICLQFAGLMLRLDARKIECHASATRYLAP